MKKLAVRQLIDHLKDLGMKTISIETLEKNYAGRFLQIEKQQIIEATNQGIDMFQTDLPEKITAGEVYFNSTFSENE